MRRLFPAILASLLFTAPAFAGDTCPAELQEAATSLDEARAAFKDARAALDDTNWFSRIARADDRDVEIALHREAEKAFIERRRERRDARRGFREARRANRDAPLCDAASPSSRLKTWVTGSLLGA